MLLYSHIECIHLAYYKSIQILYKCTRILLDAWIKLKKNIFFFTKASTPVVQKFKTNETIENISYGKEKQVIVYCIYSLYLLDIASNLEFGSLWSNIRLHLIRNETVTCESQRKGFYWRNKIVDVNFVKENGCVNAG